MKKNLPLNHAFQSAPAIEIAGDRQLKKAARALKRFQSAPAIEIAGDHKSIWRRTNRYHGFNPHLRSKSQVTAQGEGVPDGLTFQSAPAIEIAGDARNPRR